MHRRARHLNPGHAGALFALDARYGFALSDNSDVTTWTDRSSNAANGTQATTAYKPKYRTAIVGGQPAIQFTPAASAQKFVEGTSTITSTSATTVSVVNMGSTCPTYGRAVSLSYGTFSDSGGVSACAPCLKNDVNVQIMAFCGGGKGSIAVTADTWYHWTSTFDGTNAINRLNESTTATSATASNFTITKYRIGFAFDSGSPPGNGSTTGAWGGYVSQVSVFSSAIGASLRKRLQFANALSFKISCN